MLELPTGSITVCQEKQSFLLSNVGSNSMTSTSSYVYFYSVKSTITLKNRNAMRYISILVINTSNHSQYGNKCPITLRHFGQIDNLSLYLLSLLSAHKAKSTWRTARIIVRKDLNSNPAFLNQISSKKESLSMGIIANSQSFIRINEEDEIEAFRSLGQSKIISNRDRSYLIAENLWTTLIRLHDSGIARWRNW